ncbi:MAG: hypothetical protein ACXQTS_00110 [Candidatus Methanospirareceae archaeon]
MKQEGKRVMALDVNAGHIDFAVMEKENFKVVSVGRVEIHVTLPSGVSPYEGDGSLRGRRRGRLPGDAW